MKWLDYSLMPLLVPAFSVTEGEADTDAHESEGREQ